MNKWRKPNGSLVSDPDEYAQSWEDLAKPIEDHLGWYMVSCNPDLVFSRKSETSYSDEMLKLSVGAVQDITKLIEAAKE